MNNHFDEQYLINDQLKDMLKSNSIDGIVEFITNHRPQYLYKYVSLGAPNDEKEISNPILPQLTNLSRIKLYDLEHSLLYFSKLTQFDDEEEYNNIQLSSKNKAIKEQFNKMRECEKRDLVCSLCGETGLSPLLWVHYANCYQGFRLKFKLIERKEHYLYKVFYTDKQYTVDISDNNGWQNIFDLVRYTKEAKWLGQNEYRIALGEVPNIPDSQIWPKKTYSDCGLILEEITIGANCKEEYKVILNDIATKKKIPVSEQPVILPTDINYERYCNAYNLSGKESNFIKDTLKLRSKCNA